MIAHNTPSLFDLLPQAAPPATTESPASAERDAAAARRSPEDAAFWERVMAAQRRGRRDRPYQVEAIEGGPRGRGVRACLADHPSTLVVSATGTGKGRLIGMVTGLFKRRVLILQHREELLRQNMRHVAASTGEKASIEKAEYRAYGQARVIVSTPQTLVSGRGRTHMKPPAGWPDGEPFFPHSIPFSRVRRMERLNPRDFDAVIVDEGHRVRTRSYELILDYFAKGNPDLKVILFTATPKRHDKKKLAKVCRSMAFLFPMGEAIADGYLVPIEAYSPVISALDLSGVSVSGGDFNETELAAVMEFEGVLHGIAIATIEQAFDVLLVPSNVTPIDKLGQNSDLLAGLLAGSRMGGQPTPDAVSDPAGAGADGTSPGAAQDIQTTQATVLNGAQVTSATAIVMSVTAGELPRDAGIGMLQTFFNLTPEKAEQVMGSAGNPKVPTTPNPVPNTEPAGANEHAAAAPTAGAPAGDGSGEPGAAGGDGKSAPGHRRPGPGVVAPVVAKSAGAARPLPQGEKLAGLLLATFDRQRDAVLAGIGAKSLDDLERDLSDRWKAKGQVAFWEAEDGTIDPLQLHARKRAAGRIRRKDDDRRELPPRFVPLDEWDESLADAARPVLEAIALDEGKAVLQRVGAAQDVFAVFERNVPKAAQQLSLKFAASTNATTSMQLDAALSKLRDEISSGLVEGDARVELRKRVQAVFDQASKDRAETIARTEASRAAHTGELQGAKDSGVVSGKRWLLSDDACPVCVAMAAKGTIPLDATFAEFGGEYGSIDGPPCHPNDQCSLGYEIMDRPEDA